MRLKLKFGGQKNKLGHHLLKPDSRNCEAPTL